MNFIMKINLCCWQIIIIYDSEIYLVIYKCYLVILALYILFHQKDKEQNKL